MTFPAGQHFVPEMLQKRFVDLDGMLWVYDKRRPSQGIWRSKPKGIFKERHIYTVAHPDGSPSPLVERALGAVENAADPVLEQIIQRVRAGRTLDLSPADRKTLLLFLYVQHKRSPEFFRSFPLDERIENLALTAIRRMEEQQGPITLDQRAAYLSVEGLGQLEQALRMGVMMNVSPQIFGVLDARGIAVAFIPRPDRSFLLGSLPLARFKSPRGREDLGDPQTELWLPIASDVAVTTYGVKGEEQIFHLVENPPIRQINDALIGQSNVIASGSQDLMAAVVRRLSRGSRSKG